MNKTAMLVIAILALAVSGFAQAAKVIELSPEDAKRAQQLHEASERAAKAEADFRNWVQDHYLVVAESDKDRGDCQVATFIGQSIASYTGSGTIIIRGDGLVMNDDSRDQCDPKAIAERKREKEESEKWKREHPTQYYRRGWSCGEFIFSEDFRFIVPKPDPVVLPDKPKYWGWQSGSVPTVQ